MVVITVDLKEGQKVNCRTTGLKTHKKLLTGFDDYHSGISPDAIFLEMQSKVIRSFAKKGAEITRYAEFLKKSLLKVEHEMRNN